MLIGQGATGSVYRIQRNGTDWAVKVMERTAETEREVEIGTFFSRFPQFVPVLETRQSETAIEMAMPYLPRTLLDLMAVPSMPSCLQPLPVKRIFSLFSQVLAAVQTMHSLGYVHKDLKLENMLYHQRRVYLCDFGYSRPFISGQKSLCDNLGSLHYAAPELWERHSYQGPEVDVWALGVCLYVLSTGCFPFGGDTPREVYENLRSLRRGRLLFPPHSCRSSRLRHLIRRMLTLDPDQRPTLDQVEQHPFILGFRQKIAKKKHMTMTLSSPSLRTFQPPPSHLTPSSSLPQSLQKLALPPSIPSSSSSSSPPPPPSSHASPKFAAPSPSASSSTSSSLLVAPPPYASSSIIYSSSATSSPAERQIIATTFSFEDEEPEGRVSMSPPSPLPIYPTHESSKKKAKRHPVYWFSRLLLCTRQG